MTEPRLEQVFKISGVPTSTFVWPTQFDELKVALRTPGRGVILEGPSGIGKSTAASKALEEIGATEGALSLSARDPADRDYIDRLSDLQPFGRVLVDDFHRLGRGVQERIADLLKVLADREDEESQLILVGINEAGRSLVSYAPDLANRIDVIKLETEPDTKIAELIELGERALNIRIAAANDVVAASQGSFYIAQLLCHSLCTAGGVTDAADGPTKVVDPSFSRVRRQVMSRQETRFGESVRRFARGTKFRPSGRAPYLHILKWLSEASTWSISLHDEMAKHPTEKRSVSQVVDKGYLERLVQEDGIRELLDFSTSTAVLSVEDPHLIFYLQNLDWAEFTASVGFTNVEYETEYDFALSFAGEDRPFAEALRNAIEDLSHTVFYDQAEQHLILAEDVEGYLGPIYASGATFVVAILGEKYGEKRWTIFESDQYRDRIDRGGVIPVVSTRLGLGATDRFRDVGRLSFDPGGDMRDQAQSLAATISAKLQASRQARP